MTVTRRKHFWRMLSVFVMVFLLLSTVAGQQPKVINSGDWKDTLSASTFFEGEKFLVRNPGEAEQAIAEHNQSAVVINSERSPGFPGLSSRLGSKSKSFSYQDVYRNSSKLDKVYVVNPHFAQEALTVLPEAVKEGEALTFYSPGLMDRMEETETVLVGFYNELPSETNWGEHYSAENPQELNREFLREHYSGDSIVLTDAESPGFSSLLDGDPLLLRGDAEKDAELLQELNVGTIKVIGSDNTDYARTLNSLTSQDLKLAVKVGRAVAGQKTADLYGVKSLETDTRKGKLKIGKAVYDQSEGLLRVGLEASRASSVTFEELQIREGNEMTSQILVHGFYLKRGEEKNLVINVQEGLVPTEIWIKGRLNQKDWQNKTAVEVSDINTSSINLQREGNMVSVNKAVDKLYVSSGDGFRSLEKIGSETFRTSQSLDEGMNATAFSGDNIYLKEISGSRKEDKIIYLIGLSTLLVVGFFSLVFYKEFIEGFELSP